MKIGNQDDNQDERESAILEHYDDFANYPNHRDRNGDDKQDD